LLETNLFDFIPVLLLGPVEEYESGHEACVEEYHHNDYSNDGTLRTAYVARISKV
jgi:hypothetical protein